MLLLGALCAASWAQGGGDERPLLAEMSLQLALASLNEEGVGRPDPYLAASPSVVWRPGLVGAGGGVKTLVAVRHLSVYVAPYLRGEFWWFTASGGWLFQVARPVGGETPRIHGAYAELGISPNLIDFLWGRLGVDATMTLYIPMSADHGASSVAWLTETLLPDGGFRDFVDRALFSPTFGIGITYSFPL